MPCPRGLPQVRAPPSVPETVGCILLGLRTRFQAAHLADQALGLESLGPGELSFPPTFGGLRSRRLFVLQVQNQEVLVTGWVCSFLIGGSLPLFHNFENGGAQLPGALAPLPRLRWQRKGSGAVAWEGSGGHGQRRELQSCQRAGPLRARLAEGAPCGVLGWDHSREGRRLYHTLLDAPETLSNLLWP